MTWHLANYGCSGKRQDRTKQLVLFLTLSPPVSLFISTVVHHRQKCELASKQVDEMTWHLANYGCSRKRQDTTKK
jgi:hypothetical protein